MSSKKPIVLLTNDDGPPSPSSPNIYGFAKVLREKLGWDVRVVVPDCQKSWVGKAYAIGDVIVGRYFYPLEPDGLKGEITETRRPLKDGELMEWVLLNGTPATCSNIGLYNIYPGEIDLVISGPNHGKNASTAFGLSSGTIGAALAASLSSFPSIALSYGVVSRPVPPRAITLAHDISAQIVARLWADWGKDAGDRYHYRHEMDDKRERGADDPPATVQGGKMDMRGKVALYSVNVPLIEDKLEEGNRKIWWTRMWRNGYGQLFKEKPAEPASSAAGSAPIDSSNSPTQTSGASTSKSSAGPAAVSADSSAPTQERQADVAVWEHARQDGGTPHGNAMRYHFQPEMKPLVFPDEEIMTPGSDMWAMHHGMISVTPLQPAFAEPGLGSMGLSNEVCDRNEHMSGAREFKL